MRRHNWTPKSHTRICSDHFITGTIYLQDSQISNDYVSCYCYSGKPNNHQIHPDFVPSKFPEVYKVIQKQHRQATDANLSTLHRCMERAARQGRLEDENIMNKSINEKEQEKLVIIGKKKSREEKKQRKIEENEKLKKEKEEKKKAEEASFIEVQEKVETMIAEKERQRIEEEKRHATTSPISPL